MPVAAGLATTAAGFGWRPMASLLLALSSGLGSAAPVEALPLPAPPSVSRPPQVLPLSARWCLGSQPGVAPLCILLEEPRTERQYAMGLQRRPPLPPLRGMWFAYDPPQPARFWMHQTPAPLDMLFVAQGRVIAIETGVPPCPHLPCRSYGPAIAVQGVLELAAGEAARLGITVGTAVRIESLPPGFSAASGST